MNNFEFHKIGNQVASGWYCLIKTQEQLETFLEHMGRRVADNWRKIKDSPPNKDGHCSTQEAGMLKTLLIMEMRKRGVEELSFIDSLNFMTDISTKSVINTFLKEGKVYAGKNGACRPDTTLLDCEEILETLSSKNLVFPTRSKKEFSIKRWPGGNHFYVIENGNSIEIEGKIKWKTVKAAQGALDYHFLSVSRQSN